MNKREAKEKAVVIGHTKAGKPIYKTDRPSHRFKDSGLGWEGSSFSEHSDSLFVGSESLGVLPDDLVKHGGRLGYEMARDPAYEKNVLEVFSGHLESAKRLWDEVGGESSRGPVFDEDAYKKAGHGPFSVARNHYKGLVRLIEKLKEEVAGRRAAWEEEKNHRPIILNNGETKEEQWQRFDQS